MSIKTLLLAGVLSIAAVSAAQAGGASGAGGDIRGHASAAPACDTVSCPVLATEGPGGPADDNGRGSGRVATEGGPSNPGDHNGARMAGDGGPTTAGESAAFASLGGRGGLGGEV